MPEKTSRPAVRSFFPYVLAFAGACALAACSSGGGPYRSPWDYNMSADGARAANEAPSRLDVPAGRDRAAPPDFLDPLLSYPEALPPEDGVINDVLAFRQAGMNTRLSARPESGASSAPNEYAREGSSGPSFFGSAYPAPPSAPVRVGLLLPMSGPNADLGQSLLQAAQMAMFDLGYPSFEILPKDTKGTQNGARAAAEDAVRDGAELLIGPVFSEAVRGAAPVANRYDVNMLAFSTDWTLVGKNTYIMGFLPFAQVNRIVSYAAGQGLNRIGVVVPDTPYGRAVLDSYKMASRQWPLETVETLKFLPFDQNLDEELRAFSRYDARKKADDLRMENVANHAESEDVSSMLDPAFMPYDAVLMAVGGNQARTIAGSLSYYDLPPRYVRRLGTGLMDDPSLALESALDGTFFAAPSPRLHKDFEQRYAGVYGEVPPRLASLAYDATSLAVLLARTTETSRSERTEQAGFFARYAASSPFSDRALTSPNGFAGIDGIFRFRPDGLIERGLAVLGYQGGRIVEIDPAPKTFQKAPGQI